MTNEEILQGNELIAKFMGAKIDSTPPFVIAKFTERPHEKEVFVAYEIIYLQYHSSFDWLMPVVEKIESLGYNSKLWFVLERSKHQMQFFAKDFHKEVIEESSTKREAVYKAVLAFITWYNNQQNTKA